jgi:hypothetical protein
MTCAVGGTWPSGWAVRTRSGVSMLLGLNPQSLQAVQIEHAQVLPACGKTLTTCFAHVLRHSPLSRVKQHPRPVHLGMLIE